jgi:hypothetical protein
MLNIFGDALLIATRMDRPLPSRHDDRHPRPSDKTLPSERWAAPSWWR